MIATDSGTITTIQGFGFSFWKPGLFQQGRREERKQKKDADLTNVYALVWDGVGTRGNNKAKQSCCWGLASRRDGTGSGGWGGTYLGHRCRTGGMARSPPTAPMRQPSLGISTERERVHACMGSGTSPRSRERREYMRLSSAMRRAICSDGIERRGEVAVGESEEMAMD